MAGILIGYGVVLAGLGLLVRQLAPAFGAVARIAGLAGGSLCLVWGLAAALGLKGCAWAILTTIAMTVVLLSQTAHLWMESNAASLGVRWLVTAMTLLTLGMLTYLLYGERPPEFYQAGANQRGDATAKANHAPSGGRAGRR